MKCRKSRGFTLAETLIAVAIVLVLMGVAFIAVQNYQRSLRQLEYDGIAKEIFIAAQNHLTLADGQGLVDRRWKDDDSTIIGDDDDIKSGEGIYYFVVQKEHSPNDANVLNLMLPQFSIDETVRSGGSYLVRYRKSTATVLDVFYSPRKSAEPRFGHDYDGTEFNLIKENKNTKEARRNYNNTGEILGYYGGEDMDIERVDLKKPVLEVINEEKLKVLVGYPHDDLTNVYLQLRIKGETSKKEVSIDLIKNGESQIDTVKSNNAYFDANDPNEDGKSFEIILDDISVSKGHFFNRFSQFTPGEQLTITAEVYSNSALGSPIETEEETNSLFASVEDDGTYNVAFIRHLENLDGKISRVNEDKNPVKAKQIDSLSWNTFLTQNKPGEDSEAKVFLQQSGSTKAGSYYPVSPDYVLDYDGLNYDGTSFRVSDVTIDYEGNAGMFGVLPNGCAVSNLELLDFNVSGAVSAGALAGTVNSSTISNVLAHHTVKTDAYKTPTISCTGNAGGLIGSTTDCEVSKCAASLVVNGSTNAGGLIGVASGDRSEVTACYSGGHTVSGIPSGAKAKYDGTHIATFPVRYDTTDYNVTGGTTAGGLIGNAGNTEITNCYSTCSASGTTAGGFVGMGGNMTNCYCTGLVDGTTKGAFTGASTANANNCQYFEIINERKDTATGGYTYLGPTSGTGASGITALDADANAYSLFCGDDWQSTKPYDTMLNVYYVKDKKPVYNLQTIGQLLGGDDKLKESESDKTVYFVATHYGDWPAPEEFVFN